MSKYKILFLCHGNICRSPMAHFLFNAEIKKRGLDKVLSSSSAALSSEEIGNPVYPPVKRILDAMKIDSSSHRAHQVTEAELNDHDLIVVMDDSNLRLIRYITDPASLEGKLFKMMSFAGSTRDVADPWYTNDFQTTCEDLTAAIAGMLSYLEEQGVYRQ